MVEIIEKFLILAADFLNKLFLFEVEFNPGEYVPIGKIVVAFIFITTSIYLILNALGISESEGE